MLTYSSLCQAGKHGHISAELGWLQGTYGTQKNYTILYFSVAYMQHKFLLDKIQFNHHDSM